MPHSEGKPEKFSWLTNKAFLSVLGALFALVFIVLKNDLLEMKNLAVDRQKYGDLILAMNNKLNLLIEQEVGDDVGQMLPGGADANWRLSPEIEHLRM